MSSKVTKNLESEPELIKCKNCRQDILKDKMFLHEGFCNRNNVFCDHCEKVFLKKDYSYHVKLIQQNNNQKDSDSSAHSQKSKDTQSETFKPSSFNEDSENISNNVITIIPKPSLEIVQMPVTEMYKINAPIFVSENGQIVSNQNKNEYLLPLLGINFRISKISEKILDDIIDKGDIFKENNTISQNSDDFQDLNNILNQNNLISRNSIAINTNSIQNLRKSDFSLESNPFKPNNTINFLNQNKYNNNSNQNYSQTIEINKINSIEDNNKENKKPNNQTINNSLIYNSISNHSQKLLNRKYNFLTLQQTPKKYPMNNNIIYKSIKRNKKEKIPLDSNNKNKKSQKNIDNYNYQSYKKEPKDSNSKHNSNRKSIQFYNISGQKKVSQYYQSAKGKLSIDYDITRCEYCHNLFTPIKFSKHIHNCKHHKKISKKFDIPKPRKKAHIKEAFLCVDDEETGINEKNRETLKRQFNASLNVLSLNCEKKLNNGFIRTQQYKKESKKISLKKRLFYGFNEEKKYGKNYPEDSLRVEIDKMEKNKLLKKNNSISLDSNNRLNYNLDLNDNKSPMIDTSSRYVPSGEIEPWLIFNNNKVILKHPKNKKSLRNSHF